MESNHPQKLSGVYRICGILLGKDSLETEIKIDQKYKAFGINILENSQYVHPQ